MKAGKHKSFKLQHGALTRQFKDVEVRHPSHVKRDKDGNVLSHVEMKDRWEIVGTELKIEVNPGGKHRTVEVPVTVGFLPDHVITD